MLKRLVALGREPASSTSTSPGTTCSRHFREPIAFAAKRFGGAAEVARHERVAVRRLEDVLDELCGSGPPPRCFLKMDTSLDERLRDGPPGRAAAARVALDGTREPMTDRAGAPLGPEAPGLHMSTV